MTVSSLAIDYVEFVRGYYATNDFIPLHSPVFNGKEREYVLDTLDSTFVSSVGTFVDKFEEKITAYTGANYAVATVNGTAALHVALRCMGVNKGEEVITSPLTFVATCNAIRYCGSEPVFVDIDRTTLGLSPERLGEFLDRHTEVRDDGLCWNRSTDKVIRACLPIHNLGHPAKTEDIKSVCKNYRIALIEDAAESLGSFRLGRHTGTVGDIGVISFNGNKIITTGGGGALITDNEKIAKSAKHITTTAKLAHPWLYIHDEVGFNYRLPNINAALGCAQMEELGKFLKSKRYLASLYNQWFEKRSVEFVLEIDDSTSNYWLNAILLKNRKERDEFLRLTNENGVMTRPMWTPMHTMDMYKVCQRTDLSTAESIESRLVNIPSSVS